MSNILIKVYWWFATGFGYVNHIPKKQWGVVILASLIATPITGVLYFFYAWYITARTQRNNLI